MVLSLNVDANPGIVEQFLKDKMYTVPVLLAHEYIDLAMPELSIPRIWIVKSGVLTMEHVGFGKPDEWIAGMLAQVEPASPR